MATSRPKVPIYPRPVSPLQAESCYLDPRDIVYASSSSEDDEDARAAKRRRIEKLGEQYLRGDGLHILSAGLRGPFNKGWKNPWAKSKRPTKRITFEIPETEVKSTENLQKHQVERVPAASRRHVEDWLRKNNTYSAPELPEQTSPTPSVVRLVDPNATLQHNPGFERSNIAASEVPSNRDLGLEISGNAAGKSKACLALGPSASTPLVRNEVPNDAPIERRAWVSHSANADRAEFAALKSRRRAIGVEPPSTMLSPREYKRVSEEEQKPGNFDEYTELPKKAPEAMGPPQMAWSSIVPLEATNGTRHGKENSNEFRTTHSEPRKNTETGQAITSNTSVLFPTMSADTSHTSVANLPSAQPRSLLIRAPSTEIQTISEPMLEEFESTAEASNRKNRDVNMENMNAAEQIQQKPDQTDETVFQFSLTTNVMDTANVEKQARLLAEIAKEGLGIGTQERLDSTSPLLFSTIKRQPTTERNLGETPTATTRYRTDDITRTERRNQNERISSGSSQGSLKMSLRISKMQSSAAGKENKSVRIEEGEINMCSPTGFRDAPNDSPKHASNPKRLKSGLKPLGPSSSAVPFSSTKYSVSTGVDGGQQLPLIDDNNFNLDEAIDDLGSYLGTWDAEKEASILTRGS